MYKARKSKKFVTSQDLNNPSNRDAYENDTPPMQDKFG